MPIVTAASIQASVDRYDAMTAPFTMISVGTALAAERTAMQQRDASIDEDFGAWVELVPFCLHPGYRCNDDPWNSFYRPMSSGTYKDGKIFHCLDITDANVEAVEHWSARARGLLHPLLRARYADVVWDLGRLIAKVGKRDVGMARIAIDAYLDALARNLTGDNHEAFFVAQRAVDLAVQIGDKAHVDLTRQALLKRQDPHGFGLDLVD